MSEFALRSCFPIATFVIVHGAWGGGWEWTEVARRLRALGHDVFTPTLTGMGERAHLLAGAPVGTEVHAADVVNLLELEDLHDVVLCGASFGGMAVTVAADRAADRVRQVVYIDALIPDDGESALDLLPAGFGEMVRAGIAEHGLAWRVPMPDELRDALLPEGSLPDDVRAGYLRRVRDHPAASFVEPVSLSGAADALPRAFVRCTTGDLATGMGEDPIEAMTARAIAAGWPYRELAAPHDPQLYNPEGTAEVLDALSRQWRAVGTPPPANAALSAIPTVKRHYRR